MLPFTGGTPVPVSAVLALVDAARESDAIEGVSLLGGEPLAHAPGVAVLAEGARQRGLSVMVFSGYTLEEARQMREPAVAELLARTDILVDGPYVRERPETRRRWIGSANQRIHFLSDRYRADDPRWLLSNTLEIRLRGAELTVNGFPSASAVGVWKRIEIRRPQPAVSGQPTTNPEAGSTIVGGVAPALKADR
jgi:anaerobic ribonucleoside-triphosphate reductase activating protein